MGKSQVRKRKAATGRSIRESEYSPPKLTQPEWVVDMHRYFGAHGYYRATDLDRVLGNPAGHTDARAIPQFPANGKK